MFRRTVPLIGMVERDDGTDRAVSLPRRVPTVLRDEVTVEFREHPRPKTVNTPWMVVGPINHWVFTYFQTLVIADPGNAGEATGDDHADLVSEAPHMLRRQFEVSSSQAWPAAV
jgi:hypothetical protein